MSFNYQDKPGYWSTSDLPLAATIALFQPMAEIDRSDPRRARFIFENTELVQDTVARYDSGHLLVHPKDFFYELKGIKTQLYSHM